MNIIFSSDVFSKFLTKRLSGKSLLKEDLMIDNIFSNKENELHLSNVTLQEIEKHARSCGLENYLEVYIKDLHDNGRIKPYRAKKEYEGIVDQYKSLDEEPKFIITEKTSSISTESINKICFTEKIDKPNKNWVLINLMANKTVTLRYSDFKNQKDIEKTFNDFFSMSESTKEVFIIDSYCNVTSHQLFLTIKATGYKVKIHTSSFKKEDFLKTKLKNDLKQYFGKRNTTVKFSSDKTILHERIIFVECFTLESNHDFAEIKKSNSNWKIDITACNDLKNQNLQKCDSYS